MDEETTKEINDRYLGYVDSLTSALKDRDYTAVVEAVDAYMDFAKGKEAEAKLLKSRGAVSPFGDKSKFYSSIQEELPALLIKDRLAKMLGDARFERHNFVLGGQVCVIRQCVTPDANMWSETKNIDFCFAVEIRNLSNSFVPLFGLEVKKYMDKTMFTTVMDTVRSLSYLRASSQYGFLVEEEARSAEVVINSPIADREFILSGQKRIRDGRRTISPDVIENLHMTLENWASRSIRQLESA